MTPEQNKLLREWPQILVPMVAKAKGEEMIALAQIGQLIKEVQNAQRAMDIEFYLPFQEEKKVELRKNIGKLLKKVKKLIEAKEIKPDSLEGLQKFIEEKLIF